MISARSLVGQPGWPAPFRKSAAMYLWWLAVKVKSSLVVPFFWCQSGRPREASLLLKKPICHEGVHVAVIAIVWRYFEFFHRSFKTYCVSKILNEQNATLLFTHPKQFDIVVGKGKTHRIDFF